MSGTLEFDPEECLDKLLLFDLEKTGAEKIFDKIIEKWPDNGTYYIEHHHETNAFCERKDKKNKLNKTKLLKLSKLLIQK